MNTLSCFIVLVALGDFAIDMFTVYNEQTLGVAVLGLWSLYVVFAFQSMLIDWELLFGRQGDDLDG